jgi:hypothetical protein
MTAIDTRLDAKLATWVEHGLLDRAQARAIASFERDTVPLTPRPPDAVSGAPHEPPPTLGAGVTAEHTSRGVIAEALGYVGASLALGAAGALLVQVWDQLRPGGQVALALVLTLVLAGSAASLRSVTSPALVRLGATLASSSVLGAAWTTGLLASEVAGWRSTVVGLTVGVTALLLGALVQARRPSIPAQLVTLGGLLVTATSTLQLPRLAPDLFWSGLLVWSLGVAWVALARGGWLRPARAGESLGAMVALVAALIAGAEARPVAGSLLVIVTAAVLVSASVLLGGAHLLVLGALGLFVGVPRLVFELFGDTLGAPALLLVVGLLLVMLAIGIARAGREVAPRRRGGER